MTAVRVLGSWRTAGDIYARVSGVWRKVTGVRVHSGGSWLSVPGFVAPFTATAPTEDSGYQTTNKPIFATVVSNGVTITPAGGVSPYTYAWTRLSGSSLITATSPTMAFTQFSARIANTTVSATFGWVATDANGATASGLVFVSLQVEAQS